VVRACGKRSGARSGYEHSRLTARRQRSLRVCRSSMVPVQAVGFEGLAKRVAAQDEMAAVYAAKLEELEATINTVKRNLELSTGLQLAELKQRHVQNMQRMLHVRRR